jgi:hypothetical protein
MKAISILIILLLGSTAYGQESQYEVAIRKQYGMQADYSEMDPNSSEAAELIVKHTYPPLIELMGGEAQYIQLIRSAADMEEEEEYEDDYEDEEEGRWTLKESRVELGQIGEVYKSGNELQAVVEIVETDVYGDRDEIYKRYQLAISRDGGEFWYFLDGTMDWDKIVPNLHEAIQQPEEKEETVFK